LENTALDLVAIHRQFLGVTAQFSISRWANRAIAWVATSCSTVILQGKKLFGAESLVMNLAGSFNEILKVGAGEEISEIDEFAVIGVFDVDDTPAVLTTAHLLPIYNNVLLAANNGKWNCVLFQSD
jgi:hypothetical protein